MGTSYYIDAKLGNDGNTGTSTGKAWKSLENLKEKIFKPGDSILFKTGTEYIGQLRIKGSGATNKPIVISKYGQGAKPVFHANGKYRDAILIANQDNIEISGLACTNKGETREKFRTGMRILAEDYGAMKNIHVNGIDVYDVNGTLEKEDEAEGHGLLFVNRGKKPSWFDSLLIENCHLKNIDRNGLCGYSAFYYRDSCWYPNINVIIRKNLLESIAGDGIKPWGCEGCLVEYNILRGGRERVEDYAAGIWAWSSDNTLFQYNEVSHMKGKKDGEAYDCDYNSRNTIYQYNYSHDNEGGFMLVCSPSPNNWNISTNISIIRYNISQNDGERLFHMAGQSSNTLIYNNTIYVGKGQKIQAFLFGDWEGWPDRLFVNNNIFYADSGAVLNVCYSVGPVNDKGEYPLNKPGIGKSTNNFFSNNVYYGTFNGWPQDKKAIIVNPQLKNPGKAGDGINSLGVYKLLPSSPCIDKGIIFSTSIKTDILGNQILNYPDIGAIESK